MWAAIKFAAVGVKFRYSARKSKDRLIADLKKLSLLRAVRRKTNGIVAFVVGDNVVLFKLRFPLIHTGKPILYVKIEESNNHSEVRGIFTFAVYARVILWLVLLLSMAFLAISSMRFIRGLQGDADALFLIAVILRMLIGPLVAYVTLTWYRWTMRQCESDMSDIATGLEEASK